jgi:hypothetical protein
MSFSRHRFSAALLIGLGFAASLLLPAQPAAADDQVGVLECNVSPGVGFIVGASRALACRFLPVHGHPQFYFGTINQLGLNIGFTGAGKLVWTVFAASDSWRHDTLAGHYVGASAEASLGAGLGANALIGGNGKTIDLQPLSFNAQTGLNLAAGVGELTLEPAPHPLWHRHHHHI